MPNSAPASLDGPSTCPVKLKKNKAVVYPMPFGLDRLAGSHHADYPLVVGLLWHGAELRSTPAIRRHGGKT